MEWRVEPTQAKLACMDSHLWMRAAPSVIALLAACSSPEAPESTPAATIVPPAGPVLLASDQRSRAVTLIEVQTGRRVADIPMPDGPHEIAASVDGRLVVATLPGNYAGFRWPWKPAGNQVAVIDVVSATVTRVIDLGGYRFPHGVLFLNDQRTVAVTSGPGRAVVFVDATTGSLIDTVGAGEEAEPHMLAATSDGRLLYSADLHGRTVTEIDATTRSVRRVIDVPGEPSDIAVTPDGKTAWVIEAINEKYSVLVADLTTGSIVARHEGFDLPRRVVMSPDGRLVVVTDPGRSEIRVFEVAAARELARITTAADDGPSGAAFTPDSRLAYIALLGGGVLEIEPATARILRRIDTGSIRPDGLVYIPQN